MAFDVVKEIYKGQLKEGRIKRNIKCILFKHKYNEVCEPISGSAFGFGLITYTCERCGFFYSDYYS